MLVEIAAVAGSAPREAGAFMLVAETDAHGTIGGGALEFQMIQQARRLLRENTDAARLSIPLGPGIGQCCGGRVEIAFVRLVGPIAADLLNRVRAAEAALRPVYVFGAGHVGLALATALLPLPVRTVLVDTRKEQLDKAAADIETRLSAIPEAEVERAPPGAAFVAVTNDHVLDFLITAAALKRGDSPYIGMIGSRTKRAQFRRWFFENGGNAAQLAELVSPIGDSGVDDKRPEVIAALTAAEIIVKMNHQPSKWALPAAAGTMAKGTG
ncbi:MAG: xanthine dehydrogenase accessory protein XdhC [Alphaproteobacteria bacterium]|nr:xanthine dehydrogenase accessory protein XdhC [Alphaproteobacteria bacterium]